MKTKVKPKPPVLNRLIRNMTSEAYHSLEGTWSSSQLKDVIKDEEVFIKKYIKKEIPREENDAFDVGTYFHVGTLEPHKVKEEIAIYKGKVRSGKEWIEFKKNNAGKTIITAGQKVQGDELIKAVRASPVALEYIQGEAEISLFVKLTVWNGNIYAAELGKVLTRSGWQDFVGNIGKGWDLILKTRADCLGDVFVSDLKSTSGDCKNKHSVRQSISSYGYDLSAALYVDLFSLVRPAVRSFYWIFASKKSPCVSKTWKATKSQLEVGRAKYMWAILRMADMARANWEVVDYLSEVEPLPHELEWLTERETDLL